MNAPLLAALGLVMSILASGLVQAAAPAPFRPIPYDNETMEMYLEPGEYRMGYSMNSTGAGVSIYGPGGELVREKKIHGNGMTTLLIAAAGNHTFAWEGRGNFAIFDPAFQTGRLEDKERSVQISLDGPRAYIISWDAPEAFVELDADRPIDVLIITDDWRTWRRSAEVTALKEQVSNADALSFLFLESAAPTYLSVTTGPSAERIGPASGDAPVPGLPLVLLAMGLCLMAGRRMSDRRM